MKVLQKLAKYFGLNSAQELVSEGKVSLSQEQDGRLREFLGDENYQRAIDAANKELEGENAEQELNEAISALQSHREEAEGQADQTEGQNPHSHGQSQVDVASEIRQLIEQNQSLQQKVETLEKTPEGTSG